MKFTCTKENLLQSIDLTSGVASKQSNLPILTNILIRVDESKVEFIATNLEIAVKSLLRAKVEQSGSFTVPAKTLIDYVRLLPDEQIHISLEGQEVIVTCGSSSTKIKGTPADEYPVIPDIEEENGYSILADALRESLSKTVVAVAKNEIRPELSGVYFGFFTERYSGLVLAATDSYRLAEKQVSTMQGEANIECIVPARTVHEMVRLVGLAKGEDAESQVRLWVSDSQIAMRYGNFEMTSRLVDGKYPDYAQIIPTEFKTNALFPVDVMTNKIKAASLFSATGINAVSFTVDPTGGHVEVSSTSSQTGEHSSQVDATVQGDKNNILLNFRYVLDGLSHIDESEVEFLVNGSDVPCMLRPKGKENYLYLVMPVRQ